MLQTHEVDPSGALSIVVRRVGYSSQDKRRHGHLNKSMLKVNNNSLQIKSG